MCQECFLMLGMQTWTITTTNKQIKRLPTKNWRSHPRSAGPYTPVITQSMSALCTNRLALWGHAAYLSCLQGLGDCKDSIHVGWTKEKMNEWNPYYYIAIFSKKKKRPWDSWLWGRWCQEAHRKEGGTRESLTPALFKGDLCELTVCSEGLMSQ